MDTITKEEAERAIAEYNKLADPELWIDTILPCSATHVSLFASGVFHAYYVSGDALHMVECDEEIHFYRVV